MKREEFEDNESLDLLKESGSNVFLTTIDDVINWGRKNSLWPLTFATSCCGIEMMAAGAPRHDFAQIWNGSLQSQSHARLMLLLLQVLLLIKWLLY